MAHVNSDQLANAVNSLSLGSKDQIFEQLRHKNATAGVEGIKECFDTFDVDRDGYLDESEFKELLRHLFRKKDRSHSVSEKQATDMLKLLDEDQDGKINFAEFKICWHHWFKQILDPVSVLVVVDVQNDFISGTMAIDTCPAGQNAMEVVPVINSLIENVKFDAVVYSADWHPSNHISFIENIEQRKIHHTSKMDGSQAKKMDTVVFSGPPVMEQKLWPSHCVQNSWGAEYHPDLTMVDGAVHINKGTNPDIDSYSAFWDNKKLSQTALVKELTRHAVTDVYCCGLAYDVCVGATAMHAIEHGFRTVLIEDASRGVELDDIQATRDRLVRNGGVVVQSEEVADMVRGVDRRSELGLQAALNVAMARKLVKEEQAKKTSGKGNSSLDTAK